MTRDLSLEHKSSIGKASVKSKYHTVVIDPPWTVVCGLTKVKFYRLGRKLPYKTMSDEEIASFPIDDFADAECDLFIWTTQTKLCVALEIMKKWGFQYHALLTWDKQSGTCICGFYRRTELVVYGYRGRQGINVGKGRYIPTLFKGKPKAHSQKPDIFYETLRKRSKPPRIDIFARKRHYGFDAFGDEVETHIEVPLQVKLLEASNQ